MSDDRAHLPALPGFAEGQGDQLGAATLPLGLRIFFDDELFRRCDAVADRLSKAQGIVPQHLLGKKEACFAVVSKALTWRLDPYAVATATYQTPGGQVGYYGSLCHAILEASGRINGGIHYEHYGDWAPVQGKFKILTSQRGTKYPAPNWDAAAEIGLGVVVRAHIKGEQKPREMRFDLIQAYPRNSTLWATDPRTQICYTAVRRFATSVAPALMMGLPFDYERHEEFVPADGLDQRPAMTDYQKTKQVVSEPESPSPPSAPPKTRGRRKADPAVTLPPAASNAPSASPGAASVEHMDAPDDEAAPIHQNEEEDAPEGQEQAYFFTDAQGDLHSFVDPVDAITEYGKILEGAAGDLQRLEAVWENGGALVDALRRDGFEPEAETMCKQYAELIAALPGESEPATEQAPDEQAPDEQAPEHPLARYDVPMAAGSNPTEWFRPARAMLDAMAKEGCTGDEFTAWRQRHAAQIEALGALDAKTWITSLNLALRGFENLKR